MIGFTATAMIPLTMINIINNLSPLVTVVLAYFLLKERIACFELFLIMLTIIGVFDVVIFADGDDSDTTQSYNSTIVLVVWCFLIANPFLCAGGNIAMRKMKKFHDACVAWYLNWTVVLVNVSICLIAGFGFGPIGAFDWVSWMLSFGTGFFGVAGQTCRFMAFKRQKASKL